jgi:hypothetical protein
MMNFTAPGMLMINAAVVAGALGLAALEVKRVVQRTDSVVLETFQNHLPYLKLGIPIYLVFLLGLSFLNSRVSQGVPRPLWLSLYGQVLMWNAVLGMFAFVFGMAGIVAGRTGSPRRWRLWLLGIALLAMFGGMEWHLDRPIAGELYNRVDLDGTILQSSGYSCTAAATANILKSFGVAKTEREVAGVFGTTARGTTDEQVVNGLRRWGFSAEPITVASRDPTKVTPPAILDVQLAGLNDISHAVALMGWDNGRAMIIDPMTGRQLVTAAALRESWNGGAVLIRPAQH